MLLAHIGISGWIDTIHYYCDIFTESIIEVTCTFFIIVIGVTREVTALITFLCLFESKVITLNP